MNLASTIKQVRTDRNKTQDALSVASGVPVGTIRGIEQGQVNDPRLSTFARLVRTMGLTTSQIMALMSEY